MQGAAIGLYFILTESLIYFLSVSPAYKSCKSLEYRLIRAKIKSREDMHSYFSSEDERAFEKVEEANQDSDSDFEA